MQRMRRLHVARRANEIDICSRCCTTIPHPLLVAGSLMLHGRTVRKVPAVGGAAGLPIEASAFVTDAAEEGRG
jgi:hypothetical protein